MPTTLTPAIKNQLTKAKKAASGTIPNMLKTNVQEVFSKIMPREQAKHAARKYFATGTLALAFVFGFAHSVHAAAPQQGVVDNAHAPTMNLKPGPRTCAAISKAVPAYGKLSMQESAMAEHLIDLRDKLPLHSRHWQALDTDIMETLTAAQQNLDSAQELSDWSKQNCGQTIASYGSPR